jgi:hypothetical protein
MGGGGQPAAVRMIYPRQPAAVRMIYPRRARPFNETRDDFQGPRVTMDRLPSRINRETPDLPPRASLATPTELDFISSDVEIARQILDATEPQTPKRAEYSIDRCYTRVRRVDGHLQSPRVHVHTPCTRRVHVSICTYKNSVTTGIREAGRSCVEAMHREELLVLRQDHHWRPRSHCCDCSLYIQYCSRDIVKASVEGSAAPAELEQLLYHRFHPPPVRLWEGVVVVIFSWC